MAEKQSSQTQQNEEPKAGYQRLVDENLDRVSSFMTEVQKLERQNVEQATQAIEEASKMMKDYLGYSLRLHEQWTKIALETSRRAATWMPAPWM